MIKYYCGKEYILRQHYFHRRWHVNNLINAIYCWDTYPQFTWGGNWYENPLYFIFLSCTPDSFDLFMRLTLLMLQSNLYEMPLFFVSSPWLMLTACPRSLPFISCNIQFKTHPGCCRLKTPFPCVCANRIVLHFCVTSVTSFWKCSRYAWMGGDLRVKWGHTKGITSPSCHGSTWGSPKCSYRDVAERKMNWLKSLLCGYWKLDWNM